jgi:antitoxin VapB
MPLQVRSRQAEDLADDALAKQVGETQLEAVPPALPECIERVRQTYSTRRLVDELDKIAVHCATLPVQDARCADQIVGYDDHGVPRK